MVILGAGNVLIGRTTLTGGTGSLEVEQNNIGGFTAVLNSSNSIEPSIYFRSVGTAAKSIINSNVEMTFAINNTERMRIASGGNVLIGLTSSGTNKFAVSAGGTTSDLYVNSSGAIGSYTFGTGTVYASGGILTMTNPSDKRLKKDIKLFLK
jgi:hypothetical protein